MRVLILTILLIWSTAFGQTRNDTAQVYRLLRQSYSDTVTFSYTTFIDSTYLAHIDLNIQYEQICKLSFEPFEKQSHVNKKKNKRVCQDEIRLSEQEKNEIIQQINRQDDMNWLQSYETKGKYIHHDTLSTIFQSESEPCRVISRYFGPYRHIFSKPIFIRNKTICFMYVADLFCEEGMGGLRVFVKRNGVWKQFSSIANWIT